MLKLQGGEIRTVRHRRLIVMYVATLRLSGPAANVENLRAPTALAAISSNMDLSSGVAMSNKEIQEVFDMMGLASQEERDKYLFKDLEELEEMVKCKNSELGESWLFE